MVLGQCSPSHPWDRRGHSLFLHPPVWVKETSISPKVLHKHLLLYRHAREARVWVGTPDRAHGPGHQGFRGMSTPSYHRLNLQISKLYRVCFCYLAYRLEYYLILVHHIHSSLHHVRENWA